LDKKKLRLGFIEHTSKVFDIPGEIVGGLPRVTVDGGGKVNVENHRGLITYSNGEVTVNSSVGLIRVKGENLELSAMSDTELVARGRIYSVEFVM